MPLRSRVGAGDDEEAPSRRGRFPVSLRKARTVLTAPPEFRRLYIKAVLLIAFFRAVLNFFSFRRAVSIMKRLETVMRVRQTATPEDLAAAIRLASGALLRERPCLPQALALSLLYRRRGIASRLTIGVRMGAENKLEAHAWVEHRGYIVIGWLPDLHEYKPLPDLGI